MQIRHAARSRKPTHIPIPAYDHPLSDALIGAAVMIPAAIDLMVSLKNMPGPIWDYLIATHNAQKHQRKEALPVKNCVVCAFDVMLAVSGKHDPVPVARQFRDDPAETQSIPVPDETMAMFMPAGGPG